MSRVVNPETAGKERTQLVRGVYLALRSLMEKQEVDAETKDLAAFVVFALKTIWDGVDASVIPWEKRGYWIKADRFRMEWLWTQTLGMAMQKAVLDEDWMQVAQLSSRVATKLGTVALPKRHQLGTPWVGAWQRLLTSPPWLN